MIMSEHGAILSVWSALILLFCISVVDSATYFLDQKNGDLLNDGLSLQSPFKDQKQAVKALRPGDTLEIVGILTNPSYKQAFAFTNVSDPHLWHQENTLQIMGVRGAVAPCEG
jgi:hypothetical protein